MQKLTGALIGLIFSTLLSSPLNAKVFESRYLRWWGGAPACLDIPGSKAEPGQSLQLYPCHNQPNQNFLNDEANGSFRSYRGDVCLDLENGVVEEGRRVALWTCWDGDPQKFRYDAAVGLLRYRANEEFCVAVNDDLKGLHLSRCDASSGKQVFDFKHAFGERRLDEVSFVTAHNAHVSSGEASWLFPNQSRKLEDQLRDGVRAFMIDTYSRDGRIELCHGDCDGIKGFGYASPRQTFDDFMRRLLIYMNQYPDVIVTLFLEDYSDEQDMRLALDQLSGFDEIHFDPYRENVRGKGWPTLDELITRNHRLLIISDKPNKKDLGIGFAQDFTTENYWSLGTFGTDTACKKRWDNIPLDVTYGPMNPLFIMNQFRDIPTGIGANIDNKSGTLINRIEDKCLPAVKRKPNFVAVDFYEAAYSGVFKVVETLNQTVAALFENDQFTGKSQLLQPGEYNKDHLLVGNDKATSILVFRHGAVDVFANDNFQTWLGRFEANSSNIGSDANDKISSARVEYR